MSQLFTLVTYILSSSSLHVYQKAPRMSRAATIATRIKDSESFVSVTFPKSCCEDGIWLQPRITNLWSDFCMIGRGKEMADISAVPAPACTRLESFRFEDEDDYENEIFLILSSARARANQRHFGGKIW